MKEAVLPEGLQVTTHRLRQIINATIIYGIILDFHTILRNMTLVDGGITGCREAVLMVHAHLSVKPATIISILLARLRE